MAETMDVHIVSIALGVTDWVGDAALGHLMKAPDSNQGGPITLLNVYASNGAATGAGTGFSLQLENWGTGGTAIKAGAAGTVAAAIGGTADPWAANTPKEFTLLYPELAAGEWLVLRKLETNSSDPIRAVVHVEYLLGE